MGSKGVRMNPGRQEEDEHPTSPGGWLMQDCQRPLRIYVRLASLSETQWGEKPTGAIPKADGTLDRLDERHLGLQCGGVEGYVGAGRQSRCCGHQRQVARSPRRSHVMSHDRCWPCGRIGTSAGFPLYATSSARRVSLSGDATTASSRCH